MQRMEHVQRLRRVQRPQHVQRMQAVHAAGRMAHPPTCAWSLGEGKSFAAFLSHYKVEAGSDARYIADMIRGIAAQPAFLDSENLVDLRTLFEHGVHASDVIVLLATKGVLTRPWCLLELWEAHRMSIPVHALANPDVARDHELFVSSRLLCPVKSDGGARAAAG